MALVTVEPASVATLSVFVAADRSVAPSVAGTVMTVDCTDVSSPVPLLLPLPPVVDTARDAVMLPVEVVGAVASASVVTLSVFMAADCSVAPAVAVTIGDVASEIVVAVCIGVLSLVIDSVRDVVVAPVDVVAAAAVVLLPFPGLSLFTTVDCTDVSPVLSPVAVVLPVELAVALAVVVETTDGDAVVPLVEVGAVVLAAVVGVGCVVAELAWPSAVSVEIPADLAFTDPIVEDKE